MSATCAEDNGRITAGLLLQIEGKAFRKERSRFGESCKGSVSPRAAAESSAGCREGARDLHGQPRAGDAHL